VALALALTVGSTLVSSVALAQYPGGRIGATTGNAAANAAAANAAAANAAAANATAANAAASNAAAANAAAANAAAARAAAVNAANANAAAANAVGANAAAANAAAANAVGANAAAVNAATVNASAATAAAAANASGAGLSAQQSYYYLYNSLLYGMQGAAGGYVSPEVQAQTQAQAAQAASAYFTNGAAMTAVPTAGPTATYFSDGAEATTATTSAVPDYAFSPPLATAPVFAVDAGTPAPPEPPVPIDAGVVPATTSTGAGTGEPPPAEAPPPEAPPAAPPGPRRYAATPTPASALTAVPPQYQERAQPQATERTTSPESGSVPLHSSASERAGPTARVTPTVVWSMLGGVSIGALLVFVGTRIGSRPPTLPARRS
jgi:hypothetical protein